MTLSNASNLGDVDFNPEGIDRTTQGQIVPIGSGLPYNVQIPIGKLLDVLMALAQGLSDLMLNRSKTVEPSFSKSSIPKPAQASI